MTFALLGAGFWAPYQLAAWQETGRHECRVVCDPNPERARALAEKAGIPGWTADPAEAMEGVDFVDIVAPVERHAELVLLAAQKGRAAICQKPLAETWEQAKSMKEACDRAGVPLLVHENYRWQTPFRAFKQILDSGAAGTAFRATFTSITSFDVLGNQPALGELEDYILMDMGTHILDMVRCLFGEAELVYCQAHRAHPHIKGEDAATTMLKMASGMTVIASIAEAETPLENDTFPETMIFVEGDQGSVELCGGFGVKATNRQGTRMTLHPPIPYRWAHPDYLLSQSSMVPLIHNLSDHLEGRVLAETRAEDNLKTLELVFASYESFRNEALVRLPLASP